MPSRRVTLTAFVGFVVIAAASFGIGTFSSGKKMQTIQFDLGRPIVDAAKASGISEFSVRNVNGYVSYSVNSIAPTVVAHYARPGFEVMWHPIFAFTMYGDDRRGRVVEAVSLQLDKTFDNDAQAQAFVEQTIGQFQKGKWRRYYDPTWETLLTGRSSLLDQQGKITSPATTIDPAYKIEASDWLTLVGGGAMWRWVGDGVIARLSVDADRGIGSAAPTYRIDLDFDLLDVKLQQDENNAAERRKEGDARGQNATAAHEKSKVDRLEVLKALEANALKRGDAVVVAH